MSLNLLTTSNAKRSGVSSDLLVQSFFQSIIKQILINMCICHKEVKKQIDILDFLEDIVN